MMRYRYHTMDWKLIISIIVVVVVVLALMWNRSSLIEFSGPKEITMLIRPNESRVFNATIKSFPGAASYSNYSWHADGRNIFRIEEISENFRGNVSRFPLESGEVRRLRFNITLVRESPPEGRYFIDFYLDASVKGRLKRISNTYRLWVELKSA